MDATGSSSSQVTLSLSGSEVLVLADALNRLSLESLTEAGTADRRVLMDLAATLEPLVEVAFSNDYAAHLERARSDVLRS